jgi:ABC-type Mn2+/Zn2+ transport system permease subunit
MRNNSLVVMEIIWIVTGVLCLIAGTRLAFTGGSNKIPVFALMALICFVFAWLRHRQRKKS